METTDQIIHRLARLGIVDRHRLLRAGISDREIESRLRRGSLRLVHPGVYATFGTRLRYDGRVLAACLASGPEAVASHRSALMLWDLLDGEHPVEVTAPREDHPRPGLVVVHRPLDLRAADVTTRRDVPITNPMRSLLDAGAVLTRPHVGECVERALNQKLVTVKGLRVILQDLGRRGRTGSAALRGHLDRRALGDDRPDSLLEPLMARLLLGNVAIGPVEYQATVRLEGRTLHPDFLVRLAKVVVEVDGLDAHSSREALDYDLDRQNLLIRHGFLVLRYTRTHLRRPAKVTAEIVSVSRERIAALGLDPAA